MWLACKLSVIYILVATVWDVDGVSIAREALPTSSPGIQISEAQRNQPRVVPPNTLSNPTEANHIPEFKGPMMPPQPPFGTNQMPQQQFMMPPQNRPPPEMMMMMMSSPPPPMMTTSRQQQNKHETMQGNVTTTMMPSMLNNTRANNNTRREADHNSTTTTSSPITTSAHGVENLMRLAVPPQQALGAPPPGMVPFNPMASFSSPMMMNQVFIDQMGRVMMLVPQPAFFDPIRNTFVLRDNNMPQQMQGPQGPPVPQMMVQAPMQLLPMPIPQQPMQPMFIPGQMGPQQQMPFGFNPNMPQQQQQQPFPSRTEEQKPQLNATVTRH